jgi:ketosteroid isomerase-like protein
MRAAIVALLLVALSPSGSRSAEPAPPIQTGQFRQLMETLAQGWNEGDADKAVGCFTEDAVYVEPPDKQVYRGRAQLYRFFGGDAGREQAMQMTWHHLIFDEERQIGAGEFTFSYGGQVHGMVIVRIQGGRISNWREYWYESPLDWEQFTKQDPF